ncbi:hypothetical protein LEP1GSC204_0439 [Leptospira interrogans serovar Copenhageni str. M20]|nr:hypothetical protein LEP1GSC112_3190 [Leptospira interrogans serovar Pomona str. UT364]EMY52569.1 hypothetical protein LEP1GSC204_0439 [Leptospira interrogans serovar Copenhageni str. M20]
MEKHKGKITLNSNPGKTVFRVELPINPENNIVKVETRNKKL